MQFYAQHAVPFVMGTTGGDRAKLVRAGLARTVVVLAAQRAICCAQEAEVSAAGAYAVIAPQMGKQLVAFQARALRRNFRRTLGAYLCALRGAQAAFEMIAERFPDAFAGYELRVTESHQSSKVCAPCVPRVVAHPH